MRYERQRNTLVHEHNQLILRLIHEGSVKPKGSSSATVFTFVTVSHEVHASRWSEYDENRLGTLDPHMSQHWEIHKEPLVMDIFYEGGSSIDILNDLKHDKENPSFL